MKGKTDEEIIEFRKCQLAHIRAVAHKLHQSGENDKWLSSLEPRICKVVKNVNVPLMKALLLETEYVDKDCTDLFTLGGDIAGLLSKSGTCKPLGEYRNKAELEACISELQGNQKSKNGALVKSLKDEAHTDTLLKEIVKEEKDGTPNLCKLSNYVTYTSTRVLYS